MPKQTQAIFLRKKAKPESAAPRSITVVPPSGAALKLASMLYAPPGVEVMVTNSVRPKADWLSAPFCVLK
jgi:hypothetical protein